MLRGPEGVMQVRRRRCVGWALASALYGLCWNGCRVVPATAQEARTQCYKSQFGYVPSNVDRGETLKLAGALVLNRPDEFDGRDAKFQSPDFRTSRDDELRALETLRNVCGVSLEGWVWIPRLGRRFLIYSAF